MTPPDKSFQGTERRADFGRALFLCCCVGSVTVPEPTQLARRQGAAVIPRRRRGRRSRSAPYGSARRRCWRWPQRRAKTACLRAHAPELISRERHVPLFERHRAGGTFRKKAQRNRSRFQRLVPRKGLGFRATSSFLINALANLAEAAVYHICVVAFNGSPSLKRSDIPRPNRLGSLVARTSSRHIETYATPIPGTRASTASQAGRRTAGSNAEGHRQQG